MFQFAKKPQKVPEFLRSNIFLGGFFVLAVFGFLVFFPPFSQGFRQDLGFQKLECPMKTTPQNSYLSDDKKCTLFHPRVVCFRVADFSTRAQRVY